MELNINKMEKPEDLANNVKEPAIDWPQQDLQELVKRMEIAVPEKDEFKYSTRVAKLNWDEIAFNSYSGEDCKSAWLFMQKKLRTVRYLMELLHDAKELLNTSWPNSSKNKNKRHPDMPKRPRSSYLLFYLDKKDKVSSKNPGIDLPELSKKLGVMFKNLPPAKLEKYSTLALKEREQYKIKLEEFYQSHPEVRRNGGAVSKAVELGPTKPQTPFALYYHKRLENMESDDLGSFREQCKEHWKNLSDKKKLIWIDAALEGESNYKEELENYLLQNPTFIATPYKNVLNKEEKRLRDKLLGKPKKPPQSAYGIFSQMMMQSEEIKTIDVKNRIKSVAEQWKTCTDNEKMEFKEYSDFLMNKYKTEFASYIESLPENKRKQEIENNSVKRKKTSHDHANHHLPKNRQVSTSTDGDENIALTKPSTQEKALKRKKKRNDHEDNRDQESAEKNTDDDFINIFQAEPPAPPMSGFNLFSARYHGSDPEDAWTNLSDQEKKEYQDEVKILKKAYIKDYEKFLRGLTVEQLSAYSRLKEKEHPQHIA